MNTLQQIDSFLHGLPEGKRQDMQQLHQLMTAILPAGKLWFDSGISPEGKVINNPTIGYGSLMMQYAKGETREIFRVGLSANKTGCSVYLMGMKDKTYLSQHFGGSLGKASITGYCIRFKSLRDIDLAVLADAIKGAMEKQG